MSMMRPRNIVIALIVVGLAGLIIYRFATFSSGEKPASIEDVRRENGIPVDVFVAKTGEFTRWKKLIGSVEGIKQAPIYANMPARIRQVHAKQGQKIRSGQTIITLDPLSVSQSYSALEGARLNYENLKREYDRLKPLHEAGAISDSQFDQIKVAMESAQAALRDVSSSIRLHSPIRGVLTDMRVRAGDKIEPGSTLAVVADLSEAVIKLNVSRQDLAELQQGQLVMLNGGDDNGVRGHVSRVSLSADPQTRLFLVEITLDGEGSVLPGTLQTVKVRTAFLENALTIPIAAVVGGQQDPQTFVVKTDGTVEKRKLKVSASNSKLVVIEDGVAEGEQVVVWGANLLTGGEKVQIHKVVEDI